MKILYCGDVVGRAGRDVIVEHLPGLRRDLNLDFIIVNGENSAGGFGITGAICDDFYNAGSDCIVLGNHSFDQKDILLHTGLFEQIGEDNIYLRVQEAVEDQGKSIIH